jgi:hypothetical protein
MLWPNRIKKPKIAHYAPPTRKNVNLSMDTARPRRPRRRLGKYSAARQGGST